MELSRIEELINKKPLTREDKAEIRAAADEAKLEYVIKTKCSGCYEKLLLRLYELAEVPAAESLDGYVMKDPKHPFRLAGILWDNAGMATKRVGVLHPAVIASYFRKVEKEK